jgi:isopentenyl phosphate kinase
MFLQIFLVHVSHSDVVQCDAPRICAIYSGDTIAEHLCASMRPQRCVFVTDVAGVFVADPRADATAARISRAHLGLRSGRLRTVTEAACQRSLASSSESDTLETGIEISSSDGSYDL